jgi:hypothetical protein
MSLFVWQVILLLECSSLGLRFYLFCVANILCVSSHPDFRMYLGVVLKSR